MTTGRFLGIDFGTKRIGVSISDENGILAFPKQIILNDKNAMHNLVDIVKNEKVIEIVVGESLDFSGKPNKVSSEIDSFVLELKNKFNLPVNKQKEFLTSVEARKSSKSKQNLSKPQSHSKMKQPKKSAVDASAAALILQRYLDKKNKSL